MSNLNPMENFKNGVKHNSQKYPGQGARELGYLYSPHTSFLRISDLHPTKVQRFAVRRYRLMYRDKERGWITNNIGMCKARH